MLRKSFQVRLPDQSTFRPNKNSLQRLGKSALNDSHEGELSTVLLCDLKTAIECLAAGIKQVTEFADSLADAKSALQDQDYDVENDFTVAASEIAFLAKSLQGANPDLETGVNDLLDNLELTESLARADIAAARKKQKQLTLRLERMTGHAIAKGLSPDQLFDAGVIKTQWADINLTHFSSSKSAPVAGQYFRFEDSHTASHCVAQHHAAKRLNDEYEQRQARKQAEAKRKDEQTTQELKALVASIKEL